MRVETRHAVGEQTSTLQHVVNDQRLVNVELEVARRATNVDGNIVTHHLRREHRQRFALRRIDFARHDRAARLVFGNRNLGEPGAGPAGKPAHVVRNLGERGR